MTTTHAAPVATAARGTGDQPPPLSRWAGARSFGTWAVSYGATAAFFRAAALRGDLVTSIETDRARQLDPWPSFEQLRARGPVVPGAITYGTVSHAAITDILRRETFLTSGGHDEMPGPLRRAFHRLQDPWSAAPVDPPSMLATDGAVHARYRKLVSRAFTARAVSGLEDRIRGIADRLLDRLEASPDVRSGRPVDLVERYAALLPVAVIADMLGVPDDMHGSLLEWGDDAALTLDPALGWRGYRAAEADSRRLHTWFAAHVARLRETPGDDLLSRLAVLQDDERLTDLELRATGLLVLGAGFETTVNLIGNAVARLGEHPAEREALRDDPSLWSNAVEEVLRHDSPVQMTMRLPAEDTEVMGVPVPRGTPVILYLAGANRDPEVFTDPHRFDVRRPNAREHLSFSSGAHFCLGAGLARREGEVALRALYERFPDLRVVGAGHRRHTRVLRGYASLPVALTRP